MEDPVPRRLLLREALLHETSPKVLLILYCISTFLTYCDSVMRLGWVLLIYTACHACAGSNTGICGEHQGGQWDGC